MGSLGSTLAAGAVMHPGDYLLSPNGQFCAVLQDNGDLAVHRGRWPDRMVGPMWWTGCGSPPGSYPKNLSARLTQDGVLQVESATGQLWASGRQRPGTVPPVATMQDDGNFTLSVPGNVYWATNTYQGAVRVQNKGAYVASFSLSTGGDSGGFSEPHVAMLTWPRDARNARITFRAELGQILEPIELGTHLIRYFTMTGTSVSVKVAEVSGF